MAIDATLLQQDVQARTDALDVNRSFIVQAPAGSGKTELLIQRYLKLLGSVAEPEEVLAITFTRKAAAEMRSRVLDALRRRAAGEVPQETHQKLTSELAARVLARSSEKGWRLLENSRRMRIQTLDSMNASLARSRPLSAPAGGAGSRIVTGADLRTVYRGAAAATLDWLAEQGDINDATREVLAHVDNNTWLYLSYLAEMLKTRDQWLPFVGSGAAGQADATALRDRFENNLQFVVMSHLKLLRQAMSPYEQLSELFDYAARSLIEAGAKQNPIAALSGCHDLPGEEVSDVPAWCGIAEMLLVKNKPQFRKQLTKNQGFPTTDRDRKHVVKTMLEVMERDSECATLLDGVRWLPPVVYTDAQWSVLLALFRLLPIAVSELKRLFAEQGIVDHIEVALNAMSALGSAESPGDITLLLDYQVRHILVDEMQDTASAQYRMLEALTGGWEDGDGRTLFCVGDPMQSIYRFRNAEVGQFLLAQGHGIGQVVLQPLLLRRNFRSGSHLVDWYNRVFPVVLAARNDPMRGAVAYESAVAAPHLQGEGALQVYPVFGSNVDDEAQVGLHAVQSLLAGSDAENIVILVRSRTQLPALLSRLRNAEIAYSAVDIDKLTDLPEIIDVLALTRAASHLADRIAWLGVLRAPWIGLTWTDLHTIATGDRNATILELLRDPDRIASLSNAGRASVLKALPLLERVVINSRTETLRGRIESCWISLGGPAALRDEWAVENVYRFFDVVERHELAGNLKDVAELESILDDERISNNRPARVQVMTMHRAKGLQFDHVVLYGLGRTPGSGSPQVLNWFDMPEEHGEARKVISPIGSRADVERDPVHRFIGATAARKDRYEQGRLLYVACTRARKSLHIVGNVAVSRDGTEYRPARKDSLLHLLWPAIESQYVDAFQDWQAPIEAEDGNPWTEPVLKRLKSDWQLPEVLPLPGAAREIDAADATDLASEVSSEFYWVGTEARVAGTLVHRWLQAIAEGRASVDPEADRTQTTRRWLREFGFGEEMGAAVVARVATTVSAALNDERGRWIVQGEGFSELPLSGTSEGELVSVVLDRVRIDDAGQHWIIDYKTSSHEGGNLSAFLDAERSRYGPQLRRYAELYAAWSGVRPRCALYFPLLTEFVELT